jgi:hypothetical protein
MTTTMTTDDRHRIALLEQRQQLRHILDEHYGRVQAELGRLNGDKVRLEALFADRMELPVIGSFRNLLTAMAARWCTAAEEARKPGKDQDFGVAAGLELAAQEIEALLAATKTGEPR